VVVPFLNDPLQPAAPAAFGPTQTDWGSLRYRAVELPCEGAPARASSPQPAAPPPVVEPPSYRVVQVADEVVDEDRRRRLEDVREIELRARRERRRRPRRERPRPMEQHWYECLAFPFLTWKWLLGLAVLLSLVTSAVVAWVAEGAEREPAFFFDPESDLLIKWFFRALFVGAALSFTFSHLYWVLSSAAAGEAPHGGWPAFDVKLWLRGSGRFLAALLAGPVELAVLGFYFWTECGDLTALDRIILAELVVLAVGCGLFALAATVWGDRSADFNPLRGVELAQRLGRRGVLLVGFAALALLVLGSLALAAVERTHSPRHGFGGWLLLTCCWLGGLFVASFVLRLLGRWCAEEQAEAALSPRASL
jgi:hypothetical protein